MNFAESFVDDSLGKITLILILMFFGFIYFFFTFLFK